MAEPQDSGLSKKATDQEEIARECAALEEEIAGLRGAYEQYFLGMERQPPTLRYEALKKRLLRAKTAFVRQTALKFRINSVHTKFVTYERLWQRTLQEIENGTYKRDLFKAKLHQKQRAEKATEPAAEALLPIAAAAGGKATAPGKAGEPGKAAANGLGPGAPSAAAGAKPVPPGMRPAGAPTAPAAFADAAANGPASDLKLRAVYDAYVTAKKRCNEDVSKLDFNTVAASLKKQVPELMKKHNAKSVDFKVVIKDGKAILRAVPKE